MVIDEISKQQEIILERVQTAKEPLPAPSSANLLTRVKSYSSDELRHCFGSFGPSLSKFARTIDLEHPDLANLFSGQLTEDRPGHFGRDGSDLLRLASYGVNCEMSQYVLYNLKRVINQHELWPEISKKIDDPVRNQQHVRFIAEPELRDAIRRSKRSQPVELRVLYKKGSRLWNSQPQDFSMLVRDEIRYSVELQRAMTRYNHFMKLGLSFMADEVKKSVDFIEAKAQFDLYLGFNKVNLTQVAIILAKMIQCEFHEDLAATVCLPLDSIYEFTHIPLSRGHLKYAPQAYCLHDLPTPPDSIRKILERVEAMPELGGRAAFDHYRVVVPSFNYPDIYLTYRTVDGNVVECDNYAELKKGIDLELLKSGKTVGALLGERDGNCFFLCYFFYEQAYINS